MARLFALLAIGVPVLVIGSTSVYLSSIDGELGELAVGLLAVLVSMLALLMFGGIAIVLARPRSRAWRIVRRVGLFIIAFHCLGGGAQILATLMHDPAAAPVFGVIPLLLIPMGLVAAYVLVEDILGPPRPQLDAQ